MVLYEVVVGAAEALIGNVEGLGVTVALVIAAHYVSKGTLLALVFQNIRVVLLVLALLAISPAATIHVGWIFEFGGQVIGILSSLLGGML